ncbi:tetratricopeptide repeat protein [Rickettsiales bacterium]|nr:tetratricopeptide repeat protein [Rickettsiales bacterium]
MSREFPHTVHKDGKSTAIKITKQTLNHEIENLDLSNAEILFRSANNLFSQGSYIQAINYYNRAEALVTGRGKYVAAINISKARSYKNLGHEYANESVNFYEKAIHYSSGDQKEDLLTELGDYFFELKCYDKAEEKFQAALEMNPKSEDALCGLGNSLHASGKIEEAIEQFEKAVEYKPDSWYGLLGLARSYSAQKKYELAADAFNNFVENYEIESEDKHILIEAADACLKVQRYDDAKQHTKALGEIDTKSFAYNALVAKLKKAYIDVSDFPPPPYEEAKDSQSFSHQL